MKSCMLPTLLHFYWLPPPPPHPLIYNTTTVAPLHPHVHVPSIFFPMLYIHFLVPLLHSVPCYISNPIWLYTTWGHPVPLLIPPIALPCPYLHFSPCTITLPCPNCTSLPPLHFLPCTPFLPTPMYM